ncbi:MAG: ComEC/Rec2 family competence protein [Xenococcaceae cyanobacterium MO_188.B32]|nr:ComEC/Rec2 family competence protein [Xenococcaceae cyanobacterium MO_188.B32]
MSRNSWTILCLAYIVGLLSTGLFNWSNSDWQNLLLVAIGLGGLSIAISILIAHFPYVRKYSKVCLSTGIIAIFALVYFQLRIPQPKVNDISYLLTESSSQFIIVEGKVLTEPRLTESERIKFWFQPRQVQVSPPKKVAGKLYVTLPLSPEIDIYPGKNVSIKGILYRPKTVKNPGGFDFKTYLNREGAFAGLKGLEIEVKYDRKEPTWGWWKIRQRIINAQVSGLGSPVGELVSSMVLGRKAVDLPQDIRDRFIKAGLAHILAASGFHVSLLLAVILKVTNRFSEKSQFFIGVSTLIIYVGLTGLQPSVIRASLMGVGALVGLLLDRKVIPLGSLLLAATLLLLFNPLWIWDLGFQLSFLATFGLIITVPAITKKLDWLPPTIATVIAVPLAASIWTLPLICYVFNTVATYSILVNIVATPLVTIISLGGMISSMIAVIIPPFGSAIASFLFYPSLLLIEITKFFTSLPGSTFAVGKISLNSLLLIYLLLCLVWLSKWWQVRWYLVLLFTLTLIILPIVYNHFNLVQITVLAAKQEQVIVVRDKGKVILINSGQADTAKYTVLPFLKEQGINYLDYGIALDNSSSFSQGWSQIATSIAIENLVINPAIEPPIKINSPKIKLLPDNAELTLNSIKINVINDRPPLLKLDVKDSIWLILGKLKETKQIDIKKYLQKNNFSFSPQVFLYSGTKIEPTWLKILQPKIAIASTSRIKEDSQKLLQEKRIKSYITGENGAIIWQPKTNFKTIIDNN